MRLLITGSAGFIGFHASQQLLASGHEVVGLDNLNPYYDPALKKERLKILNTHKRFYFSKIDLRSKKKIMALFGRYHFDAVIHLAAQAGVRYSLENPDLYVQSNVEGFLNILEACRQHKTKHLIYASSSSVYGLEKRMPFKIDGNTDRSISLYGATKKANEVMAHAYWHLFGLPCTGLRFFTVYGPWMRPDLAIFLFTRKILRGEAITVYNQGKMFRDFTYIDDIVDGIVRVLKKGPRGYRLYNFGNSRSENLMDCVRLIERYAGRKAKISYKPAEKADMIKTYADIRATKREIGYAPKTQLKDGLKQFVMWYKKFYGEN